MNRPAFTHRVTCLILLLFLVCNKLSAGNTFYVATDGVDIPGNGDMANPWATITFALDNVPDGSLILVMPGLYEGRIRIRGIFASGVEVRSETPYAARLRHTGTVLTAFENAQGITLSGFDVAHSGSGAAALVVQIQDIPADGSVRDLVLENNILHDSYNNDILKINNGATDITIRGNMFYNQTGSDEHIDVNSVERITMEDNVFFNDFASSGRTNTNTTSSFIVVKDSNGSDDAFIGSNDIIIRRNVFLNWEGNAGTNFVLCGEDGQPIHEARNMTVENNLFLGNTANTMRASFGVKGCRDVLFRANTVAGDLPSNAFAMRLNREGQNPQMENIDFHNNIWSDPTGSMNDFSDTPISDTLSFTLDNNQYFNGGNPLPEGGSDLVNPSDDANSIIADPQLGNQVGLQTPFWIPGMSQFNGGHSSIRQAFVSLVAQYGTPDPGSAGVDMADAAFMPSDDILGNARDSSPDVGAVEVPSLFEIFSDGFED